MTFGSILEPRSTRRAPLLYNQQERGLNFPLAPEVIGGPGGSFFVTLPFDYCACNRLSGALRTEEWLTKNPMRLCSRGCYPHAATDLGAEWNQAESDAAS